MGSSTKLTNATNQRIAEITNEMNRAIAEQTNRTNADIARNTNASNIQMAEANNELQRRLQNEMNQYNSIGAQLERAKEAGVNPNAVIGGTLSGNTQTTLPSMQAGHADAPHMEMGAPMQGYTIENPYMEKMATINALDQIANSTIARNKAIYETEGQRLVNTEQGIKNTYADNLNALQVAISRGQAENLKEATSLIQQQNLTEQEKQNSLRASIGLMNEQQQAQFIDNYMREESRKSFLEECKNRLKKEGIPEKDWVSDETMLAYYYGQITNMDLGISQKNLNIVKQNETRANTGLIESTRRLTNAKTKGQIIENLVNEKWGEKTAEQNFRNLQKDEGVKGADIDNKKADTDNKNADTDNKRQQNKANKWTESKAYQGYMLQGLALDNMKKQAEVQESEARKRKTDAETIESVSRTTKNTVDMLMPWK